MKKNKSLEKKISESLYHILWNEGLHLDEERCIDLLQWNGKPSPLLHVQTDRRNAVTLDISYINTLIFLEDPAVCLCSPCEYIRECAAYKMREKCTIITLNPLESKMRDEYNNWKDLFHEICWDWNPNYGATRHEYEGEPCISFNKLSITPTSAEYKGNYAKVREGLFEKVEELYLLLSSDKSFYTQIKLLLEMDHEELAIVLLGEDAMQRDLAEAILRRDYKRSNP